MIKIKVEVMKDTIILQELNKIKKMEKNKLVFIIRVKWNLRFKIKLKKKLIKLKKLKVISINKKYKKLLMIFLKYPQGNNHEKKFKHLLKTKKILKVNKQTKNKNNNLK